MAIGTTAALIGASVAGSAISAGAAKSSAKSQTLAANNQLAVQKEMYDQLRTDLAPYRDTGLNALAGVNYELGLAPKPADYAGFQATPGYQFALDQGQKALERSAAASGGLFSGQTGKALVDYGTGMANQEYGNYFNRLYGLMNMGQNSAAMTGQAGQNYADQASNAFANIGNAQAAGSIGTANAINNGLGNAIGIWQYQNQTGGNTGINIGNLFGGNSWG